MVPHVFREAEMTTHRTRPTPPPSPSGNDPHPTDEETGKSRAPEGGPSGHPRKDRELRDDRKVNDYTHKGNPPKT